VLAILAVLTPGWDAARGSGGSATLLLSTTRLGRRSIPRPARLGREERTKAGALAEPERRFREATRLIAVFRSGLSQALYTRGGAGMEWRRAASRPECDGGSVGRARALCRQSRWFPIGRPDPVTVTMPRYTLLCGEWGP
jgi:hypothetical protein